MNKVIFRRPVMLLGCFLVLVLSYPSLLEPQASSAQSEMDHRADGGSSKDGLRCGEIGLAGYPLLPLSGLVALLLVAGGFMSLGRGLLRWGKVSRNELERRNLELQKKLAELERALAAHSGPDALLPICSACKSIRDEQGVWSQLESYMGKRASLKFTHSICPECARRLYPELYGRS